MRSKTGQILSTFLVLGTVAALAQATPGRTPDVPYVPTANSVVQAMLKMAGVKSTDMVYDLGCGDGRIVITAARDYGARGVCLDINPERIKEAQENAQRAGVTDRVQFAVGDFYTADIKDATVVMLYLLTSVNERLRPRLLAELKPGTRVVSNTFGMGDWKPDKEEEIDGRRIMLWTVPERK